MINHPGIIMALDIGDKRIGVAVSDPTQTLASLRPAFPNGTNGPKIASRIASVEQAILILVGIPYLPSGKKGTQAEHTEKFISHLSDMTATPISTVDERLSSIQASRLLSNSANNSLKTKRDKGIVDSAAAAVILQSYLDSKKRPSINPIKI